MSQISVELRHAKRSNLTQIDLSERYLTYLPKELYTVHSLQHLNLNRNNISHIDSSISQLHQLQTLLAQNNDIAELPKQILELRQLNILQLKGNPLTGKFISLLNYQNCCQEMNVLRSCFSIFQAKSAQTPAWLLQHSTENDKGYMAQKLNISPKKKIVQRRPMSIKSEKIIETERQQINGVMIVDTKKLQVYKQVYKSQLYSILRGQYFDLQVNVKMFAKKNQQSLNFFNNELKILSTYRHPNIILLVGMSQSDSLQIVTESSNKSLTDLVTKQSSLYAEKRGQIADQILSAVNYLHNHGIIHGNISSHSVFLDENYNVKMANFQMAHHQKQQMISKNGLKQYYAPEINEKTKLTKQSDVYAIGTLLFEFYTRPFINQSLQLRQFFQNWTNLRHKQDLPRHNKIKPQIYQKISSCRKLQPSSRPKCSDLLKFRGW